MSEQPEEPMIVRRMVGGPLDGEQMQFRRNISRLYIPNTDGGREHIYEVPSSITMGYGPWEDRPMVYMGTETASNTQSGEQD